ncbi:hypothetical protein A2Z33_02970 [Candidatus Gottesmanbacteria bacterium RBG_16_52_11]|uniref:Glycosyltransferase 2-like domain-containing protein n=1 Tax=Candidatus Gottesmanbacteria bacterium RBG_16_52_11 TaxID=1798374 RepID=A0A1F5YMC5_9BACT|nr:MAG: hypothetical protein A2Z33_02970 [Candidatus Gottesmanbacteria bacterium RBG_16_52_11]
MRKPYPLDVIVVDNGSADHTARAVSQKYPGIAVIRLSENAGFAAGNNRGAELAFRRGCAIIWFLNNDTFVDQGALSAVDAFDDPNVGLVGSKIYFAAGHEYHRTRYSGLEKGHVIWYAGGIIDWNNMYASHRGVDLVDDGRFDDPVETDFITGCSLFARAETLRSTGMFDERYFLYLEDVDLSLRVRRAGYRCVYYPKSVVWHKNASTSGRPGNRTQDYYLTRNRLLAGFRYAPLRTRFALIREGIGVLLYGTPVRKRAVRDAFTFRYGKQYEPEI